MRMKAQHGVEAKRRPVDFNQLDQLPRLKRLHVLSKAHDISK